MTGRFTGDDMNRAGPSLAGRLMLALIAVVTVVTVLTGTWFYRDAVRSEQARTAAKAEQIGDYLQGALQLALWHVDDEHAGMIGRTLMEDVDFAAVTIREAGGRVLFEQQRDGEPVVLRRVIPIVYAGEEIGRAELSLSSRSIRSELRRLLWAIGTTLLAVLLVLSLGSACLIRLFLKRPIEQLSAVAKAFGSGAPPASRAMPRNYREFDPLLSVLTGMESRIRTQIEELEANEEKFRAIFDGVNDGIFLHDAETGEILAANRRMCEMMGYAGEEVCRLTIGDLSSGTPPYRPEEAFGWIARARRGETPLFEWQARRRDGTLFWIEVNMRQAWIGGNERILVASRDITERKAAEAALRESEARFRALIEAAHSMILVLSSEGRILEANPYAEAVLGGTRQALQGEDYVEGYLPEEARPAVRADLAEVLQGRDSSDFECPVTGRDGARREFLWNVSRLEDDSGSPYGVLAIGQDITQRQELERLKNEFIATAAHELRTPLTSVKGYAELLSSGADFDLATRKEFLATIINKADSLERIIADLLDVSRVETGRMIFLEKEPCDLKLMLRRMVDAYRLEFPRYRFVASLPAGGMTFWADPYRIEQVLENLLSNAVKFSAEGSLIEVCGTVEADHVQVSVRDRGIGMTAEQAAKCFDKFYRVDASNTGKQGLGLGMSIARAIIQGHGGKIWVESEPGRGTRVSFRIPLAERGTP